MQLASEFYSNFFHLRDNTFVGVGVNVSMCL